MNWYIKPSGSSVVTAGREERGSDHSVMDNAGNSELNKNRCACMSWLKETRVYVAQVGQTCT